MKPDNPHHQRGTAHRRAEQPAIDTFTVRLPRWPILLRLSGHDPLVRTTDRIEALMLVLAVVVSLLCAPIAAAVATEVHDSNRQLYAEQARSRHFVTATISGDPAVQQDLRIITMTAPARWSVAGAEQTGTVTVPSTAKPGDPIEIWVDDNGAQVPAPSPTSRAAVEAVAAAIAIWVTVIAAAATLVAVTRAVCDRIRFAGWQHDLDGLVGHGGGHATNQP